MSHDVSSLNGGNQAWGKSNFCPATLSKTKFGIDVAISLIERHCCVIDFAFRSI